MAAANPDPGATVRDATAADLPALEQLLGHATAVPGAQARDERLLVAHDASGRLLATLRLQGRIGLAMPRCWYHLGLAVHAAAGLGLFRPQRTLLLGNDLTGAAELRDLAALPGHGDALRALAAAALQTARNDADRWGSPVIAELAGQQDAAGDSPFWRGLGRHFYRGEPAEAQARLGPAWRSHLAALLPRQLIYTSFLPDDAQAAMGRRSDAQHEIHEALQAAGFVWRQHLRIDDGGPVLEA